MNINLNKIIMDKLRKDAALRMLKYSFEPINYEYKNLTDTEKSLISESLFNELVNDIKSMDKLEDTRLTKLTVIVDYVNDFVDGVLGSEYAKNIESNIVECLNNALNYDTSKYKRSIIVFLCDSHGSSYLQTREGKHLPIEHCMVDTKGAELHGEVKRWYDKNRDNKDILLVEKSTFGCTDILNELNYKYTDAMDILWDTMNRPELNNEEIIGHDNSVIDRIYDSYSEIASRTIDIDEVEFCGVATNICVLSNVVISQTEYPQAEIFIHPNRVASYDPDLHNKALDIMKGLGINIVEP